jgi:hypothetical protein
MGFQELTEQFDHLPPAHAAARAWRPLDVKRFGTWHKRSRDEVADLMPLLARALDRLLEELADELPGQNDPLWRELSELAATVQPRAHPRGRP